MADVVRFLCGTRYDKVSSEKGRYLGNSGIFTFFINIRVAVHLIFLVPVQIFGMEIIRRPWEEIFMLAALSRREAFEIVQRYNKRNNELNEHFFWGESVIVQALHNESPEERYKLIEYMMEVRANYEINLDPIWTSLGKGSVVQEERLILKIQEWQDRINQSREYEDEMISEPFADGEFDWEENDGSFE